MSGRNVTYTLNLNSNVSQILTQADKDAAKFDNTVWQLQKTLSSFGVGLGAHFLIDAAKSWTQGAADFETAMLRIKNANDSVKFGILNQKFIDKEVDHFKLKLQESIDAYGSFLFRIKNAGLGDTAKNKLFDDLLTVSKVAGIPLSEMESSIRNTSIMLAEGVLEARHLRGLSYSHPQVIPYLADALGLKGEDEKKWAKLLNKDTSEETALQMFSQLISSGKLTKAALNPHVLLEAFSKYADDSRSKLPETLNTVQSAINELDTSWLRFKNDFVLEQKDELIDFFNDLKGGIHWLSEHEKSIINIGQNIITLIKLYAEWKVAMFALNTANGIYLAFMQGYSGLASSNISMITAQSGAYNSLAASIERLNFVQNAQNASFLTTASGMTVANTVGNRYMISAQQAASSGVIAGGVANGFKSAVMPVFITGMAIEVLRNFLPENKVEKSGLGWKEIGNTATQALWSVFSAGSMTNFTPFGDGRNIQGYGNRLGVNKEFQSLLNSEFPVSEGGSFDPITFKRKSDLIYPKLEQKGNELYEILKNYSDVLSTNHPELKYNILDLVNPVDDYGKRATDNQTLYRLLKQHGFTIPQSLSDEEESNSSLNIGGGSNHPKSPDLNPTTRIRGNSSNYITINIDRMTGVETYTVKVDSTGDKISEERVAEMVGTNLVKILTGVVNDSQLVGKHH